MSAPTIPYSTEARGLSGHTALTPRQQAEEAEIKATVLAQPHRRGNDSAQAGTAIGRLCTRKRWAVACFEAGLLYAEDVHRLKAALGLPVWRVGRSAWAAPQEGGNADFYRSKLAAANAKLLAIWLRLPVVMVDVCYLDAEAPEVHESLIGDGLATLAVHYRLRKPTFYDERGK